MADDKMNTSSWDEPSEKSGPASRWEDDKGRSPVDERRRSEEPPNDGTNIYIRGIANGVTEQDLEAEYSKFGKISKINVLIDPYTKENRGFAFVTMEKAEDAAAAIEATHGKEIFGKTLLVEAAKRGRARSPTPGQYFGKKSGPPRDYDRGRYDRRSYRDDRDYRRDDYRRDRSREYRRDRSRDRGDPRGGDKDYRRDDYRRDDRSSRYERDDRYRDSGDRHYRDRR